MKKNKKTCLLVLIIFLLGVLSSNVFATTFSVDATPNTKTVSYYGDTWTTEIRIQNNNLACDITCKVENSQTQSIPSGAIQKIIYSTTVSKAPPSPQYNQLTIQCYDTNPNWPCGGTQTQYLLLTTNYNWCGDGARNGPETCDGNSVLCSSLNNKYYSTSSASCKNDCSGYDTSSCNFCGDGIKNGGEQCDAGGNNGQVCSASYGSSCNYCTSSCATATVRGAFCGDGIKNGLENCKTCPQDNPCEDGQSACNDNGLCVDLDSNENCGAIGNRCDTIPKTSSTEQKSCSLDNTKAIQIQNIASQKCVNKVCQLQQIQQNKEENCLQQGTLCQDGRCGCNEGYSSCQSLGKCVKNAELENNAYCKCGFQCKSGICQNDKCIEGLISNFKSEKTALRPGEETEVSFNVNNPFDYSITATLVIKLGSGVGTSAIVSGQDCRESQCTTSLTIPAKGNGDVSLILSGKSISEIPLIATLSYNLGKDPVSVKKDINVKVTECGREDCSRASLTGYLVNTKIESGNFKLPIIYLFVSIFVILLISFLVHSYFKHKYHKNTKIKRESDNNEE